MSMETQRDFTGKAKTALGKCLEKIRPNGIISVKIIQKWRLMIQSNNRLGKKVLFLR